VPEAGETVFAVYRCRWLRCERFATSAPKVACPFERTDAIHYEIVYCNMQRQVFELGHGFPRQGNESLSLLQPPTNLLLAKRKVCNSLGVIHYLLQLSAHDMAHACLL